MSKNRQYTALIGGKRWAQLAKRMKTEAQWTCSQCGRTTARLAVHHITPVESARNTLELERLMYDESNLKVLCYDCHAATHQAMRQGTKDIHHKREAQRVERFLRATVGDEGDGLHTGAIIFPAGCI